MANDYALRPGLLKKGIANDDINYDENSGYVTVKGQNFLKPELNVQGTTYTSQGNFDNAWNAYDKNQKKQQYEQQVITPTAYVDPYKQKKDDLFTQIQQIMNQTAPDPYATPQYAAAAARAQQGAQQGIRAAQESFGSSGFGRSTALGNAAQHEQNNATQYLMTQVVPAIQQQLMNDRNQKLKDQYGLYDVYDKLTNNDYKLHQDQDTRVHDALNYILNEEATKQKNEEAHKATNIKNAMDLGEQYGFGVQPKDSGEALFGQVEGMPTLKARTEQRQYVQELVNSADRTGYIGPELARIIGVPEGTRTVEADYKIGQLGVAQRNASTAEKNATTSAANSQRLTDAANKPKPTPTPKPDEKESATYYSEITSAFQTKKATKQDAKDTLADNKDLFTPADYRKALDWIEKNLK